MKLLVQGLSFSYRSDPVLKNVDFSVEAGDCVAILGPNGAGKSTLLKCISRILSYSVGQITVDGADVAAMKPADRAKLVGYVPQTTFFADSTVFDAVLLGRKPYIRWEATKNDINIVENLLEQLSLSHLALRNVCELSGGEQQKVAIARALAQQPKVLLFDEPTSNLDLKNQIESVRFIREIAKDQNLAVVVTMHDLNLALRFANRFLMMKDNAICAAGGKEIITADTIKDVYGQDVLVAEVEGHTVVIPKEDVV